MMLQRLLAATAVAVVTGQLFIAGPAQAAPAAGGDSWRPTLIASEPLYDGSAVRLRYTDGVTVVANVGSEVIFKSSPTAQTTVDGKHVYEHAVKVVDAQELRPASAGRAGYAAGRSVYTDALAAGFSPAEAQREAQSQGLALTDEPPILASGCVYSEDSNPDPEFEWSGPSPPRSFETPRVSGVLA